MKKTKEEAELTKKNLINIALRELVLHGSENLTLESIAAKAGVTRGAIYWHFNNKEDLLDQLIKSKDIESLEILEQIFKSDLPPLKKLEKLITPNFPKFKTANEMKNYARIKMDLYNYYLRYGDNRNLGKTFTKYLEMTIKEAQKNGLIRADVNSLDAAFTIFSLIGGLYLRFNQSSSKYKTLESLYSVIDNYIKQIKT